MESETLVLKPERGSSKPCSIKDVFLGFSLKRNEPVLFKEKNIQYT